MRSLETTKNNANFRGVYHSKKSRTPFKIPQKSLKIPQISKTLGMPKNPLKSLKISENP